MGNYILISGALNLTRIQIQKRFWEISAGEDKNRLIVKALHGMRPFRVDGGINELHFYLLDDTVMTTYMASIVDCTFTLLMTFKWKCFNYYQIFKGNITCHKYICI